MKICCFSTVAYFVGQPCVLVLGFLSLFFNVPCGVPLAGRRSFCVILRSWAPPSQSVRARSASTESGWTSCFRSLAGDTPVSSRKKTAKYTPYALPIDASYWYMKPLWDPDTATKQKWRVRSCRRSCQRSSEPAALWCQRSVRLVSLYGVSVSLNPSR